MLELACLEKLQDLPNELGRLRKLEELIIDNGNGCAMNVSLPRSIGQLANLRVLRLYGALDPRGVGPGETNGPTKPLPATLANLHRLEELDLGRNGIRFVPPQIAKLYQLKKLGLDYNNLREIPAFVGDLLNLEELSLNSNGGVRLPQSLARVKGLQVQMGNNKLTLKDQRLLRSCFPNITFSFENEFDDDAANAEVARAKTENAARSQIRAAPQSIELYPGLRCYWPKLQAILATDDECFAISAKSKPSGRFTAP